MGTILLVRHAESTWNGSGHIQGTSDPPLSRRGRAQARALARVLAPFKPQRIESSPLARARETAQILAERLQRRLVVQPDLHEIHLGLWEGLTPKEVDRRFRRGYRRWLAGPSRVRIPEAEPIRAFRRRSLGCWKRYAAFAKRSRGTLAVVTHGGVMISILAHLLDASFDRLLVSLPLLNTAQVRITWHVNRWCVSLRDGFSTVWV